MKSVPVGRLRLPLDNYQFIAELRSPRVAAPPPEIAAAEVIAKSLLGLYRSVKWARENRYLWARACLRLHQCSISIQPCSSPEP